MHCTRPRARREGGGREEEEGRGNQPWQRVRSDARRSRTTGRDAAALLLLVVVVVMAV